MAELELTFVDMGQGDCCIIKCPDDKVIVIDCGSSGNLEEETFQAARKVLRAWTKGEVVWALILTHPDKDHYNKVISMFCEGEGLPKVNINQIFFSQSKGNSNPLGNYTQTALNRNVYDKLFGNTMLVEVTINKETAKYNKWTSGSNYSGPIGGKIKDRSYEVASGVTDGKAWSISIIAGNVSTEQAGEDKKKNTASLVTLVQYDTEKVLLMGDATPDTQTYLYETYKDEALLKNLSIFQIPHHGSAECAATANFRGMINPAALVVSVGLLNDSYCLPRYGVINDWMGCARLADTMVDTEIDYWKTSDEIGNLYGKWSELVALKNKWESGRYEYDQNLSGTFFWLNDPDDAGPGKSNTGFYGFSNKSYFLYRVKTTKDITETGIQGTFTITLS